MIWDTIEYAGPKLMPIKVEEIARINDLIIDGLFHSDISDLIFIKNEIYKISDGKITGCFIGDNYLFVKIKKGYIGAEPYIIRDLNGTSYIGIPPQRHSFNV